MGATANEGAWNGGSFISVGVPCITILISQCASCRNCGCRVSRLIYDQSKEVSEIIVGRVCEGRGINASYRFAKARSDGRTLEQTTVAEYAQKRSLASTSGRSSKQADLFL